MTRKNIEDKMFDYENSENEESGSLEKLERYQINSYSVDRAIETLIKWKENGKLIIPEFQRDYIWTYNNSCRLIDSILLSLPIPNIFVFKVIQNGEEKYLLVDGMQRITTIEQYKKGKWKQGEKKERDFRITIESSNWYGKRFEDLSDLDKQFFLDSQLSMMIFETYGENKNKENDAIYSVFERINTGSEKLSDQEIRNVVYQGVCLDKIKSSCKNPNYISLITNDQKMIKRNKNVEFFLRVLVYMNIYKQKINNSNYLLNNYEESKITNSKTQMLNNYLKFGNESLIDYEEDIRSMTKALETIKSLDTNAFYNVKKGKYEIGKKVHEIFAEALIIAIISNDFKIDISRKEFLDKKIEIWNNENLFYKKFSEKTTDPSSVVDRVNFMIAFIKGENKWNN